MAVSVQRMTIFVELRDTASARALLLRGAYDDYETALITKVVRPGDVASPHGVQEQRSGQCNSRPPGEQVLSARQRPPA